VVIGRVALRDWNTSDYQPVVVTGGPGVNHLSFSFRTVYFNFGSRGQLAVAGGGISWRLDSSPLACGRVREGGNVLNSVWLY
jgi:hypothetical protein